MIFTLSALPPSSHPLALRRVRGMMSGPGSVLCFRDYGVYDMAHLRMKAGSSLEEVGTGMERGRRPPRTFRRGDGTTAHFFECGDELRDTFEREGFKVREMEYATVINVNRKEGTEMKRVFVHILAEAV